MNYRGPERRRPILIVQHAPHEHPAAVRRALEGQGISTLWIHPYTGDSYPNTDSIGGMISLGGPMSANDEQDHPWIKSEVALLRACVDRGLPVAGICLGGQMLARALGGRVERHHTSEVGWFPLHVNEAGLADPVVGVAGESPTVYHWHGDTFFPPEGAVLLARSENCERQAYRYGERAYGFQFHPEADHQLVNEWMSCEGIEEEIAAAQEAHGTETVQDSETQRNHALKGERASLKITAAISALFRQKPVGEAPASLLEQLTLMATQRSRIQIEFEGSDRKPARLNGTVMTILTIPAGKFLVLKDDGMLLWPIRISDIRRIGATI